MTQAHNIYDAKARLSKLISYVQKSGKPITLCRNGVPVADLVPHRPAQDPLRQDQRLKGARFFDDPVAGVDEADWPVALR